MQSALSENEIGVSIVLIPYNNQDKFQLRLERDIIPTINAHPDWKFQIIIVDNSDEEYRVSLNSLQELNICPVYIWPGKNMMYGPAMNLALLADPYPYIVYLCTNHGRMYNTSWIDDLVGPMIQDEKVAMTGSHYASGCSANLFGFSSHLPRIHIQGGIFGARTKVLKAYPYAMDLKWIHGASDIYQSYQLLNAGYVLKDVPTVKSVWRQKVHLPEQWKYVHDYSEE